MMACQLDWAAEHFPAARATWTSAALAALGCVLGLSYGPREEVVARQGSDPSAVGSAGLPQAQPRYP